MKRLKIQPDLRGFMLIVVAVAWMAGILLDSWLLDSWLPKPQCEYILLTGAAIALACVILFWRESKWMLISLALLWLLLGAWRYAIASPTGNPESISTFIGAGKVELHGTVADDPKLLERSRLLLITVSNTSVDGGSSWHDAYGQIEVQIPGAPIDNPYGPNYGDNVGIEGRVQPPFSVHAPEVLASMTLPRLTVVGSGGNPIIAAFLHLRSFLASIIEQALPQPMAALLIAILLSLQTPALQPLIKVFQQTGTFHLIAPSGFKVTILAGLVVGSTGWMYKQRVKELKPLLPAQKREGYWRRWLGTSFVILIIIAYAILSGAGAAAQRACIMGILLALAPRFGRVYNVYTAMALAVLVMCIVDPFMLWNAGFQLTTIGTLGIVMFTPLFLRMFRPIDRLPFAHVILEIVAVTLAAEIATLPITAFTFNLVSMIAPVTNVLTVPLLSILIILGLLLCVTGAILLPIGILCGWIIWPLLQYTSLVVNWCASIPEAYLPVTNLDIRLVWGYYSVLVLVLVIILRRWPETRQLHQVHTASTLLSPNIQVNHVKLENKPSETKATFSFLPPKIAPVLQYAAAIILILAAGASIAAAPVNQQLSITLLNVAPAGKPPQGEAVLIHTIDDKTILIDGGLDATSLAQELDSRLPFWQRSIDMVILTSPRQDHLIGSQDVINRFQVGEVIDAGMLHPSAGYTLWRRTIRDRNLPYAQVREGSSVSLGTQASLQILWPPSPLHQGTNEELNNALIIRLIAPHFSMLFLGAAALSKYALDGLLTTIDHSYFQADVVQVVGDVNKAFPVELSTILQLAHASLVLITPGELSPKLRKEATSTILPPQVVVGPWQVIQTAQMGTMEIGSGIRGWNVSAA